MRLFGKISHIIRFSRNVSCRTTAYQGNSLLYGSLQKRHARDEGKQFRFYTQKPSNVFSLNAGTNMLRKRISFSGTPGIIKNENNNVLPVGVINASDGSKDGGFKVLVIPLNMAGSDEQTIKNTINSLNIIHKHAGQIETFAELMSNTEMSDSQPEYENIQVSEKNSLGTDRTTDDEVPDYIDPPDLLTRDELGFWESYKRPASDVDAIGNVADESIVGNSMSTHAVYETVDSEKSIPEIIANAEPNLPETEWSHITNATSQVPTMPQLQPDPKTPFTEPLIKPPHKNPAPLEEENVPPPITADVMPSTNMEADEDVQEIYALVPDGLEERLNQLAISSMQLAFEMDMTNIRDAIMRDTNSSHLTLSEMSNKDIGDPTVSVSTNVEVEASEIPEHTVPLNFNALIRGTVEIDASKISLETLDDLRIPEFNDNITSIAANICSTALQKGFPTQYTATPREYSEPFYPISDEMTRDSDKNDDTGRLALMDENAMTQDKSTMKMAVNKREMCTATVPNPNEAIEDDSTMKQVRLRDGCKHPPLKKKKKCKKACPLGDPCKEEKVCPKPKKCDKKAKSFSTTETIKASKGGSDGDKKDPCAKDKKDDPCAKDKKKEDPCAKFKKKEDPCKKDKKKEDPCAKFKKKEDPCKKKEDPCKKKEEDAKKKEDPCKKKEDPCKKKEDPCKKKEDPCKKKEDPCKKKEDPCKKKEDPCKKKEDPCKKKEDPCKKKDDKKKEDPCKKKEDPCKKKEDPCKKKEDPCKKKEDPCKKKDDKKKEDPCAKFKKKEDPCKKKEDPCKKKEDASKKKEDDCKKKEDPCAKFKKKEDPCKKKEDPCKKKEDPCKKKEDPCKKKEDPCKKKEDPCKKKEDPCKKKEDPCKKKKEDPCKKKKEDPCKKKKEDPCKKKKEDPCKKKKEDPCKKKKEDPCKKKEDPCKKKKEDPCAKFKKKKDPCAKNDSSKKADSCGTPVPKVAISNKHMHRRLILCPKNLNPTIASGMSANTVKKCLSTISLGNIFTETLAPPINDVIINFALQPKLLTYSMYTRRHYASKKKTGGGGKCDTLKTKFPKNRKPDQKARSTLRTDCFSDSAEQCPKPKCGKGCKKFKKPRKKCETENKHFNIVSPSLWNIWFPKTVSQVPIVNAQRRYIVDLASQNIKIDDQKCEQQVIDRNEIIKIPDSYKIQRVYESFPVPKDYDVLIRTGSIAITGSDIHVYENGSKSCEGMTLGHDATGFIEKVGRCIHNLHVGDRVVMESALSCGICQFCKRGVYNMCAQLVYNGFLATHQIHPADLCYKLPDTVSMEEGALTQTLALGCQACFKANIMPTTNVLIIGSCPTAVAAALCAKAIGAKKVVIAGTMQGTLEVINSDFDFEFVQFDSNALFGEVLECIYAKFKNWPNSVINCAISAMTMNLAVMALQPCGVCVLTECETECASFNALDILMKNIRMVPSFRSTNMFPTALQLMKSGRAPMHKFISTSYPWKSIEDAFKCAQHEANTGAKKVVVNCTED